MLRASSKVANPENCGETNSKIAFESCRRFRQVSPSAFETEVRPVACLFATVREQTEVRKRSRQGIGMKGGRRKRRGKGRREGGKALLTDAKTPGIVAKVKQTTVAVTHFRSTLVEETFFQTAFLPRSHCDIIVSIRHYRRGGLDKNDVSPRSTLSMLLQKWINFQN